jgi:putative transposase
MGAHQHGSNSARARARAAGPARRARPRGQAASVPAQLALRPPPGWGGARPGAGRKPTGKTRVEHRTRPAHALRHPTHITLRARAGAPSLRGDLAFGIVRRAIARLSHEDARTFQVVHFSVQRDHVHLLVEAHDKKALSRGARRLVIGIVKRLNARTGRRGPLWGDRYHRRDLRTPREVRNALVYVLTNLKKHAPELRAYDGATSGIIDTRSSAPFFQGWDRGPPPMNAPPRARCPVATAPWSWLLAEGWKRHGLVSWTAAPSRRARPHAGGPARHTAAR